MMRRIMLALCGLLLLGGTAVIAYRAGQAQLPKAELRTPLYYRDPMGKPDYAPEPKKDAMGMDYIPVYEEPETPAPKGRILYYRNPMGLADTSPVPKKDTMGMDYIAVYDGEAPDEAGTVVVSTAKIQRLGVRTEIVAPRMLARAIHATGTIQPDERRLTVFSTRFEGWIERLHVGATGQAVRAGEALMEVYAPDLLAAQQEYALAGRTQRSLAEAGPEAKAGVQGLVGAARQRLRNLGFSDAQFADLARTGPARLTTLRAPADGVVLDKPAVQGMRFMAGEMLFRIADLSTVWLVAEVFEQDLAAVREGAAVSVTLVAYPGERFAGRVAFVAPALSKETRTSRVRVEMANPDGRLKLDMSGSLDLMAPLAAGPVLAVPDSAVLDTGSKQVVLVERGEGRFEPRAVQLGSRADGFVEVREGLAAGEAVVVGANFLIDAESNMKAALRAFTKPDAGAKP